MEHFGFADDPACPAPALASLILELDKFTGHSADQARFGARAKECFLEFFEQTAVTGQPEAVIDQRLLLFTPGHELFAAKTAVRPHDDPSVRAAPANLGDNGLQGAQRTLAGIVLAGAQLGPNGHFADESIEGQVTIVAVITVKESSFLAAMKGVVGGVKVDDHLSGLLIESAHSFPDKQSLDLRVVSLDLVGASGLVVAQLPKAWLAGHARPVRALAANLKLQEFLREEHKKEQAGYRG